MPGRPKKPQPPAPRGAAAGTPAAKGILELDRFTEANLTHWNEVSADLDELNDVLYFNLEPERRRRRPELLKALEGIAYQSSKGAGVCVAVFVDRLAPGSFVEVTGNTPPGAITRLDAETADTLAGWDQIGLKRPGA